MKSILKCFAAYLKVFDGPPVGRGPPLEKCCVKQALGRVFKGAIVSQIFLFGSYQVKRRLNGGSHHTYKC